MNDLLTNPDAVRKSLEHLQHCLMALEEIKGIAGPQSPVSFIATRAIQNQPRRAGGTDLG